MYGFHNKNTFSNFIDDSINIFAIEAYGLQITFHSDKYIRIEGTYEIRKNDVIISKGDAGHNEKSENFPIGPLLNQKVVEINIEEPQKYTLVFENGYSLNIIDDDPDHEVADINGFNV